MFYVANRTALTRAKLKIFVNHEDLALSGGEAVAAEHTDVARGLRVHRNDLENIVPFFAAGWLYVLSGAPVTAGIVYFAIFSASRILHTIAYFNKWTPWRTVFFGIGVIDTLAILGHTVYTIFL